MPSLHWPRFSLRTRLATGVIAIVLVSTLGIASTALYFVKRNMQESIANDQLARLAGIADAIDQKFLSRRTLLKTLADSVEASRFPSGNELQKFLLLHDGSLRHSFDNVAILDGKGNLVANLNGSEPIGKLNIEDREYFQRTLATMSGVISQPYRNRFSGLAQIAITEPVVGVDGRVVYVLSGSINLTQQIFWASWPTSSSATRGTCSSRTQTGS